MPANNYTPSVYDREPLLQHEDEFDWEKLGPTDRNGNRIYEPVNDKLSYVPDTGIQLHPEYIQSKTFLNHGKFPKERRKLFIAFALLTFGFVCNSFSIVLTHQKVPDRKLYPHLPDISLDNITKHRWLNDVADVLVIICTFGSLLLVIFHRHRWIVCRRIAVMLGLLYTMRSFTMYATVLPLANDHVYCQPKINSSSLSETVLIMTEEVLKLIGAGGLPITGRKTLCGDYIFSGHTIILMMTYLLVHENISKRYSALHWVSWSTAWFGMICLLVSHGHYTIDVIIGYYATTRLFWMYHTFANNPDFQKKSRSNPLSEVWWFPLFRYFEGNVKGPLPKEYAMPRIRRGPGLTIRKEFLE